MCWSTTQVLSSPILSDWLPLLATCIAAEGEAGGVGGLVHAVRAVSCGPAAGQRVGAK